MTATTHTGAPALTMTPLVWGMLLLSLCWGGAFFFTGVAVQELPTFTIVLGRIGFAALALWVVVLASGTEVPRDGRFWGPIFVMGAATSVIPFLLIAWGQSHVPSGLASIFIASTPLFAVVAAHFMTADEKMTPARVAGVVVGFAGVVVLIGPDFPEGGLLGEVGTHVLAQFALVGGAVFYALSGIYGRRFARDGYSPLVAALGQLTAATVLLTPLTLWIDRPWTLPVPSLGAMLAVFGVALLSTAFASLLYFRILATAGATNLLLVNFLVPVSAVLLGVVFLDEMLTLGQAAGMGLIFAGLALRDGKLLALLRRTAD
jgi:drug/metabolite transporter (DMT)-like permease